MSAVTESPLLEERPDDGVVLLRIHRPEVLMVRPWV